MMLNEFESLTGFHPDMKMYEIIENAYYDFDGDKKQFCEAYVKDEKGLASEIQRKATLAVTKSDSEIANRDARIAELEKELEKELEWKPYEDPHNACQADYEALAAARDTEALEDWQVKDLLYNWYGFAKEKVEIIKMVDKEEVNRHGYIRKVGEYERKPLYNATDWNYIRFDCGRMSYELVNDNLRLFYQ